MNCRDLQELLVAYSNGEIQKTQKEFIEEHLNGCLECRAALAEYTKTREQLLMLRQIPEVTRLKKATMSAINSMKRHSSLQRWMRPVAIVVPVLLLLTIFLSLQGTGTFDNSSGIIAKAYAASSNLDSYRYEKDEYTQDGPEMEAIHTYHAEVDYTAPDRYRAANEKPDNHTYDSTTIVIGDQAYTDSPVVVKLEPDWFKQMDPTENRSLDMLNLLAEIASLGDETIDGVDCYHYIGEVDIDNYLEWSIPHFEISYYRMEKSSPYGMSTDLETYIKNRNESYLDQNMTFEFWIGKEDYLIRQAKLVYQTMDGEHSTWNKYKTTSIAHYHDINEEVIIDAPLDENGELLQGWSSYIIEPLIIPDFPKTTADAALERTPSDNREIPAEFTTILENAPTITGNLNSYRQYSQTYEFFDGEFQNSRNSIKEHGGYNLHHSSIESSEEYGKAYPLYKEPMALIIHDELVYTFGLMVPPSDTAEFNNNGPTTEETVRSLEMLYNIEILPEEIIDGTQCYHIKGIQDVEIFLEWTYSEFQEAYKIMNEMTDTELDFDEAWEAAQQIYQSKETSYEYWIGKNDFLIHKKIMTEMNLLDEDACNPARQVTTEYNNFNEPVRLAASLGKKAPLNEKILEITLEMASKKEHPGKYTAEQLEEMLGL